MEAIKKYDKIKNKVPIEMLREEPLISQTKKKKDLTECEEPLLSDTANYNYYGEPKNKNSYHYWPEKGEKDGRRR